MILALLIAAAATIPQLEQHLASESNASGSEPGNDYHYTLPEKVGAGNAIILQINWNANPGSTTIVVSSITDSAGDTWSATPDKSVGTASTGPKMAVFVHPNSSAGFHTVTVTFNVPATLFQMTLSEFSGIATSSPVGSTTGLTDTPDLFATLSVPRNDGQGGNLILTYWADQSTAIATPPTDYTPGPASLCGANGGCGEFKMLDASVGTFLQPHGSMYWVQSIAQDVTAAVDITGGTADTYNMIVVAVKAQYGAGTHYDPNKMRILRVLHMTKQPTGASWTMKVPCQGTMIYGATSSVNLTGVTDTKSNSYSTYFPAADNFPQVWNTAAVCDHNLKATATFSASRNDSFIWYDVINAKNAAPDVQTFISGGSSGTSGTLNNFPSDTVSTQGITFLSGGFGTGPVSGFASGAPTDAVNDYVYYSCETDGNSMDNADLRAHVYNVAGSVSQNWNWTMKNFPTFGSPGAPSFPACTGTLQNSTASVQISHFQEAAAPATPPPAPVPAPFHRYRAR
jgi:hypothetical protein